jgi:hypothetical protein
MVASFWSRVFISERVDGGLVFCLGSDEVAL